MSTAEPKTGTQGETEAPDEMGSPNETGTQGETVTHGETVTCGETVTHGETGAQGEAPAAPRATRGQPLPSPDEMRQAVAEYVAAVHAAYVRQARLLPPAVQGRMPLVAAETFSVAAVGTRHLHIVATTERLGSGTRGSVARASGEATPLRWTLSFFDPVVVPALGLVDEHDGPAAADVRRILGVRTHLYHLTLSPSSGLASHHAGHTGAGLANAHAASARDFDAIRAAVEPAVVTLVDEMEGAEIAGLRRAAGLLATQIAPDDQAVRRAASGLVQSTGEAPAVDAGELRRAVLHALRPAQASVR